MWEDRKNICKVIAEILTKNYTHVFKKLNKPPEQEQEEKYKVHNNPTAEKQ